MSGDLDKQIDRLIVAKERWAKRMEEAISQEQSGIFEVKCKVDGGTIKQLTLNFVEYLEKMLDG